MNNLKFRTVLGVCEPKKLKPEIIVFTRSATATITYDLNEKLNTLDPIDQISFLFKQGIDTTCFNMRNYLRLTEDVEAIEDKTYYTDIQPVEESSLQVTATPVVNYIDNPMAAGYYEMTSLKDGENNLYWILDRHFYLLNNILTFTMFPEETKNVVLTTPMNNMKFEVVFRLNTDSSAVGGYSDSIVIEPQPPIAVVDSLYSQVIGGDSLTVSIRPNSLASTNKSVKE